MKYLFDLKQYLKTTAAYIRENKTVLKKAHEYTPEALKAYWDLYYAVAKARKDFRHHLIAYCEMRGMARNRVEVPAENNLPNEDAIKAVKAEYAPYWEIPTVLEDSHENVRPGQA